MFDRDCDGFLSWEELAAAIANMQAIKLSPYGDATPTQGPPNGGVVTNHHDLSGASEGSTEPLDAAPVGVASTGQEGWAQHSAKDIADSALNQYGKEKVWRERGEEEEKWSGKGEG